MHFPPQTSNAKNDVKNDVNPFCSSYPSDFVQKWSFPITFSSALQLLSCRFCSEVAILEHFCITSVKAILPILLRSTHFQALLHHFWSSYPSDFAQKLSFWTTLSSPLQQLSFRVCSEVVILDQSCITSGADILHNLLRSDHFGALFHHFWSSYPSDFAQQ